MQELELEKTYLAKGLPPGLEKCRSEIIRDAYVSNDINHPRLRLRQRGAARVITKKAPVDGKDSSRQHEHTLTLDKTEFEALSQAPTASFAKRRYYCEIEGSPAEVDVYLEDLAGLVVIDFEFSDEQAMSDFKPPGLCLADVTQEEFMAGGKLAGKTYADLSPELEKYGYKPIALKGQGAGHGRKVTV